MEKIKWLDDNKFIGEQITKEDIEKWQKGKVVTIGAGTGKGKSHFIKNNLYDYAKEHNQEILLLVHRINCKQQFEMEIKGREDIITLLTYQSIEELQSKIEDFELSHYDYIVADEFHYFTSDSGLNNKTDLSLEKILEQDKSVKIFLSATADDMIFYLNVVKAYDLFHYYIKQDFSFIDGLYFYDNKKSEEYILDEIVQSGEKAIVFINDMKRLEELYLKYKDISLFNCSTTQKQYKYVNEDKIENMLMNSRFDEQLIFTTSVMDTGVSIKDEEVKHIICNYILDYNVLIQAIGRKRILHSEDKVNIYIKNIDNRSLNGHKRVAVRKREDFKFLQENGQDAYIHKKERELEDKSMIYYKSIDGKTKVKVNTMAEFKNSTDIQDYNSMIKKGYKRFISDLLQKEKYEDIDKEIKKEALDDFFKEIVGIEIFMNDKLKETLISKINLRNRNNRLVKSYKTLSTHIEEEFDMNYILIKKLSYKKESYRKKYWKLIHTR